MKDQEQQLLFKALCKYLPYDLKCIDVNTKKQKTLTVEGSIFNVDTTGLLYASVLENIKPVLRPLSDLTKDELLLKFYERFGGGYKEFRSFKKNYLDNLLYTPYTSLSYQEVEVMQELHIDYLGLIEKGLAIDINTIQS